MVQMFGCALLRLASIIAQTAEVKGLVLSTGRSSAFAVLVLAYSRGLRRWAGHERQVTQIQPRQENMQEESKYREERGEVLIGHAAMT
jgi:acid phosphatase family membrane protein YuiD